MVANINKKDLYASYSDAAKGSSNCFWTSSLRFIHGLTEYFQWGMDSLWKLPSVWLVILSLPPTYNPMPEKLRIILHKTFTHICLKWLDIGKGLTWIYLWLQPLPGCNRHHQDDITFLASGIPIGLHLPLLLDVTGRGSIPKYTQHIYPHGAFQMVNITKVGKLQ